MKVTYIAHSGFSVELPTATLLFDYYKGAMPAFPADKPLYVFASHSHGDHFNPEIFKLAEQYPQAHFILSHDIWMTRKKHTRAGVPEACFEAAQYMRAHETKEFSVDGHTVLTVTTLRSTDMGVAFLVKSDDLKIYHAGDLHWWLWTDDTKQAAGNMTANYQREIGHLLEQLGGSKNAHLDLAFLPLDPRLEENYHLGMEYFLNRISVEHVFPMHFWDNYGVISKYIKEHVNAQFCSASISYETNRIVVVPILYDIEHEGQSWYL